MNEITIFISKAPYPKSNRYIRRKGGKVFKPWKVSSWEVLASNEIRSQLKESLKENECLFSKEVEISTIIVLPNKRKRDIDNMLKTLWDVLEKERIIKNDNLINKVETVKLSIKGKEGVLLKIKEANKLSYKTYEEELKKYFS